jgi:hypothetical protein
MTMSRLVPELALCASVLLLCMSADAAQMCSGSANLDVPATSEGLYLNLISGVSGTTEASVPGFDIDIYAAVSTNPSGQLRFYWGSAATGGAGVASVGDSYAVLSGGQLIGPASLFTRAAFTGDTSAWLAGASGYLGMRFLNETSSTINYGWMLLTTTAPLGFPATILEWCYDDSGAAIGTPVSPLELVFADGFGP